MKKWYESKTLWVNILSLVGVITEGITGKQVLDVETQGVILTALNIVLRLVTKEAIIWKDNTPAPVSAPAPTEAPKQ